MKVSREDIQIILEQTDKPALLYGPRGTGKTTMARRSAKIGQTVYSVTLTAEMSSAELRGHKAIEGGDTIWQDGPAVSAWREGSLLIINEIDHAGEDCSNILHAILDDFEVARLTLPNNETVSPQEGFRAIATMNGTPDRLNDAVLDRFALILPVTRPSEEMLAVLSDETREICERNYASAEKKGSTAGDWEPDITYRTLKAFDELREVLGNEKAAYAVTIEKSQAQGLMEAVVINKKAYANA